MTYRIIPAIVLAAGMAMPALAAQDSSQTSPAKMEQWDAETRASFFSDESTFTLYPREQAMANYSKLAVNEQERLRQECMTAPNTEINPADGAKERDEAFNQLCMWIRAEPER